jgi:hypothetical protein
MTFSDVLTVLVALTGIGFLIAFMFWPLLRDVLNRKRARAGLPGLADEMGLKHNKGDTDDALGTYRGTVDGHRIAIKPDETSIEVFLQGSPASFNLMVPYGRLQRSLAPLWRMMGALREQDVEFSFGDGRLDRTILIRQADRSVAEKLISGPARRAIETFLERHLSRLSSLTVSSNSIRCRTVVGSTKRIYSITPDQVRGLLPDMMDLARTLESTIRPGD